MKGLKRGVLAFLLGELLVISKKDRGFKAKLKKKQGWDKLKYVFQSLLDFNKDLREESKTKVQEWKLGEKIQNSEVWAQQEIAKLEQLLADIETSRKTKGKKQLTTALESAHERYHDLMELLKTQRQDINQEYKLEEKLVAIKEQITKLQKRKPPKASS